MLRARRRGPPAVDLPDAGAPGRYGLWVALAVALAIAGCAGFERGDRAPSRPRAGLETLPDPVVRNEPRSRWGNDDYVEGGRTYRILPTAVGYDRIGVASWYGLKFHGRRTSSGETYDMYRLSAAHPTLPIPGFARVRNLDNGRETVVRINDRGPFHGARFLDLSYAAAVKLGFVEQGTARVRVTALAAPAGAAGTVALADTRVPSRGRYFLQAGPLSSGGGPTRASRRCATCSTKSVTPRYACCTIRRTACSGCGSGRWPRGRPRSGSGRCLPTFRRERKARP